MENIDNSKLIELINKMKEEKTAEAQNEVIGEILKSRFMCPVVLEDAPKGGGKIEVTKETKMQFSVIKTKDEKNFLIAFTSDAEVQKWQKNKVQQSIIYTFEDFAMITTNNDNLEGFVIDPMGCNIVLTKEMIKQIKSSITRESTIEKDTQVEVGLPREYPEELTSKLIDVFRNIPEVKKAYLLQMKKQEEVSYLLIIDAGGKEKEHFNDIATAAIPFLGGLPLNLVSTSTDLGQRVSADFNPFYNID